MKNKAIRCTDEKIEKDLIIDEIAKKVKGGISKSRRKLYRRYSLNELIMNSLYILLAILAGNKQVTISSLPWLNKK